VLLLPSVTPLQTSAAPCCKQGCCGQPAARHSRSPSSAMARPPDALPNGRALWQRPVEMFLDSRQH
jgi:hypothetical protein